MNKEVTAITLEILMLSDLLRMGVIDDELYNKAAQKIKSMKSVAGDADKPEILVIEQE